MLTKQALTDDTVSKVKTVPKGFNFGPFYNVQSPRHMVFDPQHRFTVGIAGGYNAFGLIGTECNGIFVLDDVRLQVVVDEIACQPGCFMGVSQPQKTLYDRLLQMTWGQFRDFINQQPRARYQLKGAELPVVPLPELFKADQFVGHAQGKYWTAEDKARWANEFVRFVQSEFDERYYDRVMYQELHQHMGFIAHYNMNGFWDARFSTRAHQIETIQCLIDTANDVTNGQAQWTWSDVRHEIGLWLRRERVLERLRKQEEQANYDREIALRDALVTKHGLPAGDR